MIDLKCTFAGLELSSPLVVSSSGLSSSVARIEKMAAAGAGAVVLKSLFEEQIRHEAGVLAEDSDYPEAGDYIKAYSRENSLEEYIFLLKKAKEAVDIPIIASINCMDGQEWTDYATRLEEAGADALELNIYYLPIDKDKEPGYYEKAYLDLVEKVRSKVKIPLIIKLGKYFTSAVWMVNQLYIRKVDGVVLFNRFYAPDMDTDALSFSAAEVLSTASDLRYSLRWIGIVSPQVEIDLAASTGVHSGLGAVKQILAGATAVQICSVLYRNGVDYIAEMNREIRTWMEKQNFQKLSDFRGRLSYAALQDPGVYERVQFMKHFSSMH